MKAIFKTASPYLKDALDLPVHDLEAAIPFYEKVMGFSLISKIDSPVRSAILGRDQIRIGLAENGGDPTQEGCFFEVDKVDAAAGELQANGLGKNPVIDFQKHGDTTWRVFFVIAPDGLCYCLGERV